MRPTLLKHSRGGRRGSRRQDHPNTSPAVEPAPPRGYDPAVERAREAGGPVDRASYACACGCQFRAPVSTTVSCPHCGADQAW